MLELGTRCRKKLFTYTNVIVHRAADIEKQQHLHRVMPLRHHFQIQPAGIARGGANGVFQVQLIRRTGARELAQFTQRHFEIARAELHAVVEIFVFALIPHFDRAAVTRLLLADTHTFRIVAVRAERTGARRAYPFAAALMPAFLFFETLFQRLHQFFPTAE